MQLLNVPRYRRKNYNVWNRNKGLFTWQKWFWSQSPIELWHPCWFPDSSQKMMVSLRYDDICDNLSDVQGTKQVIPWYYPRAGVFWIQEQNWSVSFMKAPLRLLASLPLLTVFSCWLPESRIWWQALRYQIRPFTHQLYSSSHCLPKLLLLWNRAGEMRLWNP